MTVWEFFAIGLVIFALVGKSWLLSREANEVSEMFETKGGMRAETDEPTLTLETGRKFSGAELDAVRVAKRYVEDQPDATAVDLLKWVRPANRAGRSVPQAWWADVIVPGFAATASEVDLDELRDPAINDVEPLDHDERVADIDSTTNNTPAHSETTSSEAGVAMDTESGDAPGMASEDRDTAPEPSTAVESSNELVLPDSFAVEAVRPGTNEVLVGDRTHAAWFTPVQRDGTVEFHPSTKQYDDRDVAGGWYVKAVNALESGAGHRNETDTTVDTSWLPEGASSGAVAITTIPTPGDEYQRFRCRFIESHDVQPGVESEPVSPNIREEPEPSDSGAAPTDDGGTTTRCVRVSGAGETATLGTDADGVVQFQSVDDRANHLATWATRAVAAADEFVHRHDHETETSAADPAPPHTTDDEPLQTDAESTQTDAESTQADTESREATETAVPDSAWDPARDRSPQVETDREDR